MTEDKQFATLVNVGTDWPEVVFVGRWEKAMEWAAHRRFAGRATVTAVVHPTTAMEEIEHGPDFE